MAWCAVDVRRFGLIIGIALVAACSDTGDAAPDPVTSITTTSTTATSSSTTTSTSTTTAPPPTPLECVARLDLDRRIGQLLVPLVNQSGLAAMGGHVASGQVSGVVLVENLDSAIGDELAALHAQAPPGYPIIVAIDDEGGRVQRLAGVLGRMDSAARVAAAGDREAAVALAYERGRQLVDLGFTMNLAPVADLAGGGYIGDRSYGDDPEVVTEFALATIEGAAEAGLIPVAKHFPGHGSASDSHKGLPVTHPLDELRERDLLPFVALIDQGLAAVMTGHLDVPGLTDGLPATVSAPAITGLLRDELGFDGLVVTDALGMEAISDRFSIATAVEAALAAGADLALLPSPATVSTVTGTLIEAIEQGRLTGEQLDRSVERVLAAKGVDPCEVAA